MRIERLCEHIICLIHAPIRVYNKNGVQVSVYGDNGEQQDVIDCDQEFCQMLLGLRNPDSPIVYLELKHIIYAIVAAGDETYLIGPCFLGQDERAAARYLMKAHKMNLRKPYRMSRIPFWRDFFELVSMLFEELTGHSVNTESILLSSFCDDSFTLSVQGKVQDVLFQVRENSAVHNPYSQERREQEAIQNGDLKALHLSWKESYVGQIGTLAHDPLRQAKNLGIVLITLATRSAIAGGMLPELAFSMADAFTQRLEEMNEPGEAYALGRQIEIEFCKSVRDLTANRRQNKLVTRCKELITQQLHSRLTVQGLAAQLNTTPGYLSHLFLREEGTKLIEYILRKKVEASKYQLAYTDIPFKDIASSLAFASHSHFSSAFKRITGMTPSKYRENYRMEDSSRLD